MLSIVMMIKNEEKILEKTLMALQPLMNDIKSELIILDTGSTDLSVEISKRYTENVYYKEWNNNFADMRNASISYAKGEWILILDADEELVNYEKMKKFFESDLCKKYNSGSIELKSVLSENKEEYSIGSVIRLFKNNDEFRYNGAIHEQPQYKEPVYNRVALFNHYGYLFEDEELRQIKNNRNKEILLKELKNDLNNPYLNYQLGKEYIISRKYYDAIYYMEKAYNTYLKLKLEPIYVVTDLINLYVHINEFNKAEKLCLRYLKNDNKNIDIYFYLGTSQKFLGKYRKSIGNFKRYAYLLDNYDISTQANNMYSVGDTLGYRKKYEVNIIYNYYKLEMYDEVIKSIDGISEEAISKLYNVIFISLYKINKFEEVLKIYHKLCKTIVEQERFKEALEVAITQINEKDKIKIYNILSKFEDNYGRLNKVRLGYCLNEKEYNNILKYENAVYYGELIYNSLNNNINIETIFNGINYVNMQSFINYIMVNKKECIFKLYQTVLRAPINFNRNSINIYSCLTKSLLFEGNLVGEKYDKLFLMYITYQYEYIRQLYRDDLIDEVLIDLVKDRESKFVIEFISIQKMKKKDPLEYIRKIKRLVIDNPQYKKGLQKVISKFENELDEKNEMKTLKARYNSIIEENFNENLELSLKMINEYEKIFEWDDISNVKAIYSLHNNDLEEAEMYLKLAYCNDRDDKDILFNIAYVKELLGEYKDARIFYNRALQNSESINEEILQRLSNIEGID